MKASNMHAAKLQISERTKSPEITHYSFRQEIRDLCKVLILSNFNYITSHLNRTSVGLKLIYIGFAMSVRYVYIPFYLNALITLYNVTLLSIKVSVSYSISEDLVHITLVLLNMPFMNTYI